MDNTIIIEKISNILLDYIETLRCRTEISTSEAFLKVFGAECLSKRRCNVDDQTIENIDFLDVDRAVRANASKRNLVLDSSKYNGQHIGLPYNIRYVIRKHKGGRNG